MFRKKFWSSKKTLAEQARNPRLHQFYIWGSLPRTQKRLRHLYPLNSTSAGESTIQNFAAENGTRMPTTFKDPDYQVVSPPAEALRSNIGRRDGFGRSGIETLARGQLGIRATRAENEFDLEKNEILQTTRPGVGTIDTTPNSKLNTMPSLEKTTHRSEKMITSGNLEG